GRVRAASGVDRGDDKAGRDGSTNLGGPERREVGVRGINVNGKPTLGVHTSSGNDRGTRWGAFLRDKGTGRQMTRLHNGYQVSGNFKMSCRVWAGQQRKIVLNRDREEGGG
ncbi:unnamed protein product, partial [Laminaria digitata]